MTIKSDTQHQHFLLVVIDRLIDLFKYKQSEKFSEPISDELDEYDYSYDISSFGEGY